MMQVTRNRGRTLVVFVSVLYLLSGAAGLIYQLVWFRQVGLLLGNSVQAAAVIVSVFMIGLAIGARWLGARLAERESPLAWFGYLELCIGCYGLVVPVLVTLCSFAFASMGPRQNESALAIGVLRALLAGVIFFVPTVLMGATLPCIAAAVKRCHGRFERKLGVLYGLNTVGGSIGVLVAGFWLVDSFGVWCTSLVAVAANFLVGGTVLLVGRRVFSGTGTKADAADETFEECRAAAMKARLAFLCSVAALSGAISLAFEVVWFRTLVLVFGSTTYSFSTMLSVFLLGLGAGAFIVPHWVRSRRAGFLVLGITEVVVGIATFWAIRRFNVEPYRLLDSLLSSGISWESMISFKFRMAFSFLFLPAFCFGVDIPILAAEAKRVLTSSGRSVGCVYSWNTVGATIGALVGGMLLIPCMGAMNSLKLLGYASAALGVGVLLITAGRLYRQYLAAAVCAGIVFFVGSRDWRWDEEILVSGAFFSPSALIANGHVRLLEKLDNIRVRYLKEGKVAAVAVTEDVGGMLRYVSDGKVEADTSLPSMCLQKLQGHLPLLFHPDPESALNIGLGAGITFGSISCYQLRVMECVEIEAQALGVAACFAGHNDDVLNKPNARVIIEDGRNYLLACKKSFDVITSDPFEPVHSGAGHLYTVEHFRNARNRLNDGGIMAQYLPLYEMSPEDFLTIVDSFRTVFPQSVIFYTGDDTIMLGFRDEVLLLPEVVERKFQIPEVKASLERIGIKEASQVLGMYVGDLRLLPPVPRNARLNTDARPVVEFSAPKHAVRQTTEENHAALLRLFSPIPDPWGMEEGVGAGAISEVRAGLMRAATASVLLGQGDTAHAFEELKRAHEISPANPVISHRMVVALRGEGLRAMGRGDRVAAERALTRVLELFGGEVISLASLARIRVDEGDFGAAERLLGSAFSSSPDAVVAWLSKAYYHMRKGEHEGSMQALNQAVDIDPGRLASWETYEHMSGIMGYLDESENARRRAAEIRSRYARLVPPTGRSVDAP